MQDFPAAHSMDTEWFAVDADGNIGIFNSGEGGAIPKSNYKLRVNTQEGDSQAYALGSINALFLELANESADGIVRLNFPSESILKGLDIDLKELDLEKKSLPTKILPSPLSTAWMNDYKIANPELDWSYANGNIHWLLFPSGHEYDILEILKHHGYASRETNFIVSFAGEPALVFLLHCPPTTLQMLFDKGTIRNAICLKSFRNGLATLLGLFTYWHDSYSPYSPYDRDGQPIYPLKLSDLPEKLQDAIDWNWFDKIRFSKRRSIQPMKHMRCRTWGSSE